MIIKHYLFTMFNLNFKWKNSNPKIKTIDCSSDEEYLQERIRLFEEYCIPSVRKQSNQNFEWVVLFSDRTPEKIKKIVADYESKISCFKALYFSDEETRNFRNLLVQYIKRTPADVYITSRCDNDDVLNVNYIKYIQDYVNQADNPTNYGIVYPLGYQYSPKHSDIRTYWFPNNHFSTYVSNNSEKTIFNFLHEDFGKTEEIIYIHEDEPMWIEVSHGGNVFNCMFTMNLKEYVKQVNLQENFALDIDINKTTPQVLCSYIRNIGGGVFT